MATLSSSVSENGREISVKSIYRILMNPISGFYHFLIGLYSASQRKITCIIGWFNFLFYYNPSFRIFSKLVYFEES